MVPRGWDIGPTSPMGPSPWPSSNARSHGHLHEGQPLYIHTYIHVMYSRHISTVSYSLNTSSYLFMYYCRHCPNNFDNGYQPRGWGWHCCCHSDEDLRCQWPLLWHCQSPGHLRSRWRQSSERWGKKKLQFVGHKFQANVCQVFLSFFGNCLDSVVAVVAGGPNHRNVAKHILFFVWVIYLRRKLVCGQTGVYTFN